MEKKTGRGSVVDRVHLSDRHARVAAIDGQLLTRELSGRSGNLRPRSRVHSVLARVWMD